MHAPVALPACCSHRLPLLRRRLRRAGAPGPARGGAITTGDPDHPANFGRLCSKGFALEETLGLDGRLLHPHAAARRRDATPRSIGTRRSPQSPTGFRKPSIDATGRARSRFYLSGQLLTEDYYVANKLAEGLPRLGQCRHQLAALHGLDPWRAIAAPSARTWCRAATRTSIDANLLVLVGSNTALVPSGAVPAHDAQPSRARRQDRGDRSAPHRRRATRPICFLPLRPAPTRRCSRAACAHLAGRVSCSTSAISTRTQRLRRCA